MNRPKIFRTNWLTYPKFQLLIIAINTVIVTVGFGLVDIGLHLFFTQLQKTGTDSGLASNHYYFVFLGNQSSRLYLITGLSWVGSIIIGAIASLLLSHKIVGPVVRMKSYFRGVADGSEKAPLNFRKGDFFSDLPEVVNQALRRN